MFYYLLNRNINRSNSREIFKNNMADFNYCLGLIRNITNKFEIDLRDNFLKDNMLEGIINIISNNINIKVLILWFPSNYLTDEGVKLLLSAIKKLTYLSEITINFEWNFDITDISYNEIINTIRVLSNLRSIDIRIFKYTNVSKDCNYNFINEFKNLMKNIN